MQQRRKIAQIGILVKDLDKAIQTYEAFLGVKPSHVGYTEKQAITKAEYLGKPCYGLCYQAIFNLDNIELELISPCGEGDSVWKDCLEKDGEGLHHIAFETEDIHETMQELEEQGSPLLQYGMWPATPKNGQYAYMDMRDSLKTIVELLEK